MEVMKGLSTFCAVAESSSPARSTSERPSLSFMLGERLAQLVSAWPG